MGSLAGTGEEDGEGLAYRSHAATIVAHEDCQEVVVAGGERSSVGQLDCSFLCEHCNNKVSFRQVPKQETPPIRWSHSPDWLPHPSPRHTQ